MEMSVQVEGFCLLRILSDRERSKVYLARDAASALCAVKLQKPADAGALPGIASRYAQLQPLTSREGLLPILAHGAAPHGWVWESLPMADNLSGLPPLADETGIQQYTPLTLRAWIMEHGPTSAEQVVRWGLRLARAIQVFHQAGFVHRDVKPGNILFVHGEPCLGDYGLVGKPEAAVDFNGTEGFQPLEGTNDRAADLFALGKTLYEAWTAADRLEFPSLPRAVVDGADWDSLGRHFNDLLLRACHAQPSRRFHSAAELAHALEETLAGRGGVSRRRWLVAAGGVAAAMGLGALALFKRRQPLAHVVWKRLTQQGFNIESWRGQGGTADWVRRRIYSLCVEARGCVFESFDLDRFTLQATQINNGPQSEASTILHPETRWLWAIEGGHGEVFALDPESLKVTQLGGGSATRRHFGATTYWNPLTRRVGIFGGYGQFAVRNDRSEFDDKAGQWIELEPDRRGAGPWPRTADLPFVADATGKRLLLVGGRGSPSGKQGERVPKLRAFNGQFHLLDDIWELDLEKQVWRELLPIGHLRPERLRAAVYHAQLRGLVVFEGSRPLDDQPGPAKAFLFRPDKDARPLELPSEGDRSIMSQVWAWTMDPQTADILFLASDGIFRVTLAGEG